MDYATRPRGGENPQMAAPQHAQTSNKVKKPRSVNVLKIMLSVLIFSIALLMLAVLVFFIFGGGKSEAEMIKKDKYQAVFLSDQSGQVYFGKLTVLNRNYYQLTDIYYVRVDSAVQPDKNQTAQQNISLAKLGNELHGPEDVMYISRDKVLFWENLKNDGQVVKAISDYKKNGSQSSSSSNSSNTQSTTPTTPTTNTKK